MQMLYSLTYKEMPKEYERKIAIQKQAMELYQKMKRLKVKQTLIINSGRYFNEIFKRDINADDRTENFLKYAIKITALIPEKYFSINRHKRCVHIKRLT